MTSVLYSRSHAAHCNPAQCRRERLIVALLSLSLFVVIDAHAQWRTKPAVQISFPNYSYSKTSKSLRTLDLKNSEAVFFDDRGAPEFRAALQDGTYEKRDKTGGESVEFSWLATLGNNSTDSDFAVAYYTWVTWAGSASDFGVVQLLHLRGGRLRVVQQILFNTRGSQKAGAFFNGESGVLTVRGLNEWEHCCPTGLDVVGFRLKEGLLKRVSYVRAAVER